MFKQAIIATAAASVYGLNVREAGPCDTMKIDAWIGDSADCTTAFTAEIELAVGACSEVPASATLPLPIYVLGTYAAATKSYVANVYLDAACGGDAIATVPDFKGKCTAQNTPLGQVSVMEVPQADGTLACNPPDATRADIPPACSSLVVEGFLGPGCTEGSAITPMMGSASPVGSATVDGATVPIDDTCVTVSAPEASLSVSAKVDVLGDVGNAIIYMDGLCTVQVAEFKEFAASAVGECIESPDGLASVKVTECVA